MKKALIILALISALALTLLGCSLEIFDWNQRAEIINDYLSWSGLKGDIEAYEVRYKHFGAYGDSVAIYFHTAGAYETPVEEEIAGYTFSYPDSRVIRIWNNGRFYKMPEAYDLGLITEDDVKRIYNQKIFLIFREPLFIFEEKIYCDYSDYDDWRFPGIITDLFYPDRIQVYIDANLSREGKIFDSAFFEDIEFLSIEDRSIDSNNTRGEPYRQYFKIKFSESSIENIKRVVAILESKEGIRVAEPIGIPQPGATPNDTSYVTSNDDREYWGLKRIEAEKVWDFTTGTSNVRVGVIDTGIASHEDLNDNYSINDSFDFRDVLWTEPTYYAKGDSNYHGTHVAGIIGGVGNNGKGITGVNWDVRLAQMRVLESDDRYTAITNAINFAKNTLYYEDKISILNFSIYIMKEELGGLEDAIREYTDRGGLLICIAGNDGIDLDVNYEKEQVVKLGSEYHDDPVDNIITVGAIDYENNRVLSSNWGMNTVDIYAPGGDILSTFPADICINNSEYVNSDKGQKLACECVKAGDYWYFSTEHFANGYHYISGTSMAAPFVSGVAGLLLSVNPDLTAAQLKECILNGADIITITTGDGSTQQVKRLNAWGAFKYLMEVYPLNPSTIGYSDITLVDELDADGPYMKDNTSMIKLMVENAGSYSFTVSSNSAIDVKLYKNDLGELPTIQTKSENNSTIEFTYSMDAGIYYLRTNYVNSTSSGTVYISIDCPNHTHNYTEWKKYSATLHIEKCECGATGTIKEPHVVSSTSIVGNKAVCLLCGGLINLGDDFGMIPTQSIIKVTLNGSYILPNGIIVLVDEDIEAYLNGTLVFYDKDDLPVVQ